jgi:hypothetical protein
MGLLVRDDGSVRLEQLPIIVVAIGVIGCSTTLGFSAMNNKYVYAICTMFNV